MTILDDVRARRADLKEQANAIAVQGEQRGKVLASEKRQFDKLVAEIGVLDERIEQLQDEYERRAIAAKASIPTVRVHQEERTYRPDARDAQGERYGFVADLMACRRGDSAAVERLDRHHAETGATELRTAGRNGSTFVSDFQVPDYLLSDYVPYFRASRVAANRCKLDDLPPGHASLSIPKITTGTAVDAQTADNAAITSQDVATGTVTAPALTIAGQSDYSVQMRDFSPVDWDQIVLEDLSRAIAAKTDYQVLTGSGTNGQITGVLNLAGAQSVTYTEATPTAYGLITAVQKAVNMVRTQRFAPPDSIVMASRRWAYFAQTVDDQHRPTVQPETTGLNVFGTANAISDDPLAPVGTIAGLPVFVDPQLDTIASTGQDTIIVGRFSDYWLYESPLHLRVLDEVLSGTLSLRAQGWTYIAGASRFDKSFALIKGTGTAQPSGFGS
jgi:HK97 family phage major capsid protein